MSRSRAILIYALFFLVCITRSSYGQSSSQLAGEMIHYSPLSFHLIQQMHDLRLENAFSLTDQERNSRDFMKSFSKRFVERAEQLISLDSVPRDEKFELFFHCTLGMAYKHLDDYIRAEKTLEKALSYVSGQEKDMKAVVATVRGSYANACRYNKHQDKALPQWKLLVEKYQGIGSGDQKNLLAANTVQNVVAASRSVGIDEKGITAYLNSLSTRYDNEVGCAADVELMRIARQRKDQKEIERLTDRLRSRYPDAPAYKNLKTGAPED